MHTNGLTRCAYHFGHPGTDAVAQANYFVAAVKAVGGCAALSGAKQILSRPFTLILSLWPLCRWAGSQTLQLMLDLEVTDGASPAAVWAWVQSFMGQVKVRTALSRFLHSLAPLLLLGRH